MTYDLLAAIAAGHRAQQAAHAVDNAAKADQLRGGSVGVVQTDGTILGKCARLAMARALGYEVQPDQASLNMFAAGYANEEIIAELIGHTWQGEMRTEADGGQLQLSYVLPSGRTVSTRPDLCLMDPKDPTQVGVMIETKLCSSFWTVKSVHYDLEPKTDHLIQTAHQIAQLRGMIPATGVTANPDCEGLLCYSSRSDYHLSTAPRFIAEKFAGNVYDVEYKADGTPLKIRPFDRVYRLEFDGQGRLTYHTDGLPAPVATSITLAGIQRYYQLVSAKLADQAAQLPARPSNRTATGGKSYLACDYCELRTVCDSHESKPINQWADHVAAHIKQGITR